MRPAMRVAALLVPLVAGLSGCIPELPTLEDPCAPWPDPGLYRVVMEPSDSRTRKPYVYVPNSAGPREVVVLLHGTGMSGPKMTEATGFLQLADQEGFVLVYPNGLGWPLRDWNVGAGYDDGHDDVAFLDDLVAEVAPKVCGDRVLGTGFSNGAMMVQRWGCQGANVDAIAPDAGPLLVGGCRDGRPMPVKYYHGTADEVVPVDGGVAGLRGVDLPSAQETIEVWKERNACVGEGTVVTNGDTTCTSWDCAAPTELCLVEGWGHQWPGGVNAGRTDAGATIAIWEWFAAQEPPQSEQEQGG